MNIYEINTLYQLLANELEESGGEAERNIMEDLAHDETLLVRKLEQYVKVITNTKAEIEALKSEAKRLSDRARAKSKVVERLQNIVSTSLLLRGKKKMEVGSFTLSHLDSWRLKVTDPDQVPDEYVDVQVIERRNVDTGGLKKLMVNEYGESLKMPGNGGRLETQISAEGPGVVLTLARNLQIK